MKLKEAIFEKAINQFCVRLTNNFMGLNHGIPVVIPNFWDWDRFFKSLGLGLGLQIQDKIPSTKTSRVKILRLQPTLA